MRGVRAGGTTARAKQSGASNDRRPRARGGRDQREADEARAGKGDAPRPPPEGRGRAGGGGGGQAAPHAARRHTLIIAGVRGQTPPMREARDAPQKRRALKR